MATTIPNVPVYTGDTPAIGQTQPEFNQNTADKLAFDAQVYGVVGSGGALNTTIEAINTASAEIEANAAAAEESAESAEQAAAALGYKGEWTPSTVVEAGGIYGYQGSEWRSLTGADVEPVEGDDWRSLNNYSNLIKKYQSVLDMISFEDGENNTVSTGGTIWEISNDDSGVLLDSGLYAHPKNKLHAKDFGPTLNEAFDYINSLFSDRISVVVYPYMPISDTVVLSVDCDIIIESAHLTQNLTLKPVFAPEDGWSGTCTPHFIDGKNFSALRGWLLTGEGYGCIRLDNPEFRNFGNQESNTSDSSWIGYYVSHKNSKSIELINPTCRDIYVKPNETIGDVPGSNRNVVITGEFNSADYPTNINIRNFTAINLLTEEDSDAVVVECNSSDLTEVSLDVDIYDGYANNCQKRMFKFQAQTSPQIKVSGVRIHGSSYANAGTSVKAVAPLDIQQGFNLEGNGTLIYEGAWIYGLRAKQSVLRGDLNIRAKATDDRFIDGNTTRSIYIDDGADIKLGYMSGFGHYEALRVEAGSKLELKGFDMSNNGVMGSLFGDFICGDMNYVSTNQDDLSSQYGTLTSTGNIDVRGKTAIDLTASPNPTRSGVRCSGCPTVAFMDLEAFGVQTSTIELNNIQDATLIRPVNKTTSHTVRLEGSNTNVFIDGGRNQTSVWFQPSGGTAMLQSVNERVY